MALLLPIASAACRAFTGRVTWIMVACLVFAQDLGRAQAPTTPKIDTLLRQLARSQADTNRILLLDQLSYELIYLDSEKARDYAGQGLALARQLEWNKGVALAKTSLGRVLWQLGDFDQAQSLHLEARALWDSLHVPDKVARLDIFLGQDYADAGNYPEAIQYLNRALDESGTLGKKGNQGVIHNLLSWVYGNMGRRPEAIQHEYASLKIAEESGDSHSAAVCYGNIAAYLAEDGRREEAIRMYEQALPPLEQANDFINYAGTQYSLARIYLDSHDHDQAMEHLRLGMARALQISNSTMIASGYDGIGDLMQDRGDDAGAIENYLLAAQHYETVNNRPTLAGHYTKIAKTYIRLGRFPLARQYFERSRVMTEELNSPLERSKYLEGLVLLDSVQGDWRNAFRHYRLFIASRDTVYGEENTRQVAQARMQFDFDKKEALARAEQEKKDAIARQKLERQKLLRNGFMGGFAVVMVFAGVFFYQRNRIKKGKKLSDELLLNILPAEVADELKAKGAADARLIDQVTVVFSDFMGFTQISAQHGPKDLVDEINACFSAFDLIMQRHNVEKIKTVGDAYLAAGGLPTPNTTHPVDVIRAALDMQAFIRERQIQRQAEGKFAFTARVGVHTGPVVAGIVGIKKFAYDIWGDTVNTAQRMEASSEAGRVNVSRDTFELAKDVFRFSYRGKIDAKGKGEVEMYFVEESRT